MVVLKDAPHPEQGHAFINYMMRPEVVAKSSDYVGYPNGNKDALSLVDPRLLKDPAVYPPAEVMGTLFTLETLPLKYERMRTRTGARSRTGPDANPQGNAVPVGAA